MKKLAGVEKEWYRVEKFDELRGTLFMISNWMVMPLYLVFWICDLIYVPHLKWEFFFLRASVIPVCLFINWQCRRIHSFHQSQWLALLFIAYLAGVINAMIFMIDDINTGYYAGLNLVAIGSLSFVPWERLFFALSFIAIFGPYYTSIICRIDHLHQAGGVLMNTFFIFSTVAITFIIRLFNEKLRLNAFKSRLKLNDEIGSRDSIIIQKTEEETKLNAMSRQFSPQVIEAIKSRKLQISNHIKRNDICAIFIDIVSSTEAVVQLEKEKIHNVISTFMDDTIKILLKYDITIDKFLGDGILAFANEPVPHADYAQRVTLAAFEIREKVMSRRALYEENWLSEFQIRIGIAVGQANVGFYGNERYFRTYTAIGPVINLASRLCAAAKPNQILVSLATSEHLASSDFELILIRSLKLKGFSEMDAFEVRDKRAEYSVTNSDTECDVCHQGIMTIELNPQGIYILKCNSCGAIKSDKHAQAKAS